MAEQNRSLGRVQRVLGLVAAAPLIVLGLGLAIQTSVPMPGYALVFVDDREKTYLAPQCLDEWHGRKSTTFDILRRTTAKEAFALRYKSDRICRDTGAFQAEGYSATGMLLYKIGILPKLKYWWDQPYRTEDGIIYPGTSTIQR